MVNIGSITRVLVDKYLPLEGSAITFSCPPGIGANSGSVTCTENGQWELSDSSGLVCTMKSKGTIGLRGSQKLICWNLDS